MERYCDWKKENEFRESNESFKRGWVWAKSRLLWYIMIELSFIYKNRTFNFYQVFFKKFYPKNWNGKKRRMALGQKHK